MQALNIYNLNNSVGETSSGHFSDEEIQEFRETVERGAYLFFKYARQGGLKFAY